MVRPHLCSLELGKLARRLGGDDASAAQSLCNVGLHDACAEEEDSSLKLKSSPNAWTATVHATRTQLGKITNSLHSPTKLILLFPLLRVARSKEARRGRSSRSGLRGVRLGCSFRRRGRLGGAQSSVPAIEHSNHQISHLCLASLGTVGEERLARGVEKKRQDARQAVPRSTPEGPSSRRGVSRPAGHSVSGGILKRRI